MTENDSHFYCGTTTGDVLEVDKNLHIEADESLTWQNRDLTECIKEQGVYFYHLN